MEDFAKCRKDAIREEARNILENSGFSRNPYHRAMIVAQARGDEYLAEDIIRRPQSTLTYSSYITVGRSCCPVCMLTLWYSPAVLGKTVVKPPSSSPERVFRRGKFLQYLTNLMVVRSSCTATLPDGSQSTQTSTSSAAMCLCSGCVIGKTTMPVM